MIISNDSDVTSGSDDMSDGKVQIGNVKYK